MKELTVKQFIELVNNGQWTHYEDDDYTIKSKNNDTDEPDLSEGYITLESRFEEYKIWFSKKYKWDVYDAGSVEISGGCSHGDYFKLNFKVLNEYPHFDEHLSGVQLDSLCFKVLPHEFKDVVVNVCFYNPKYDDTENC